MGIIPEPLVHIYLMAAFGVYCLMGLIMFIMGIVYMADVGALGATGLYLMMLGLIMLIVGGIALWANSAKNWLILFIIELINVALFLVLYILIVIVLMMATGTTDPVREATVETWDLTRPGLTIPNSDPDGDETASWCQTQTDGHACLDYYAAAIITTNCQMGPGYSRMQILNNCSKALDDPALMGTGDNTGCATLEPLCQACDEACMESQIQEVKDNLEPASLMVLVLIAYLFVTVVWNNIMVHGDDDIGDAAKMVGMILNGALLALSFLCMIMGGVGAFKADDACPKATDGCVPTSMIMITLIGLALMVVSGLIVAGIQLGMNLLVSLSTAVMVFLMVFLVLFGLILGMSTGMVMDDMTYYYDTQYPKLRSALEKADNSYCQMTKEQCAAVVNCAGAEGASGNPASTACTQPVQTDDYSTAVTDDDDAAVVMTFASMWKGMFAAAAQEAASTNDDGTSNAPAWLEHCATTGICIYCQDVLTPLEDADGNSANGAQAVYVWDNSATDPDPTTSFNPLIGEPCTYQQFLNEDACIVQAPNVVWSWGLTGAVFTEGDSTADPPVTGTWADSSDKWEMIGALTEALPANQPLQTTSLKCQGTQAIGFETDSDDVDGNNNCIAPFTTDEDENDALAFVRCAGMTVKEMFDDYDAASGNTAGFESDPCPAGVEVLRVEAVDSWTSKVLNYTYYHNTAQVNLPYCEEAITDYVAVDQNCKEYTDLTADEKNSYYSNCDNCNNPFAPFLFVQPGPETNYRQCLNFVVGHVADYCQANADTECLGALVAAPSQLQFMIDAAFGDANSGFCGYSDDGCKAKIKYDIEDSMQVIGILGAIFMGFFVAVIYCTLAAIKYYKGGDDDDDDDDDDSDE